MIETLHRNINLLYSIISYFYYLPAYKNPDYRGKWSTNFILGADINHEKLEIAILDLIVGVWYVVNPGLKQCL